MSFIRIKIILGIIFLSIVSCSTPESKRVEQDTMSLPSSQENNACILVAYQYENILESWIWDTKKQRYKPNISSSFQGKIELGIYTHFSLQGQHLQLDSKTDLLLENRNSTLKSCKKLLVVPSRINKQGLFRPCMKCPAFERENHFRMKQEWLAVFNTNNER